MSEPLSEEWLRKAEREADRLRRCNRHEMAGLLDALVAACRNGWRDSFARILETPDGPIAMTVRWDRVYRGTTFTRDGVEVDDPDAIVRALEGAINQKESTCDS